MITRTILITDSALEPITDQEALSHLREDSTNLSKVKIYIKAARQSIEAELISLSLVQATFELQMDDWLTDPGSSGYLTLPKCPAVSITSIKYDDVNNVEQTLATSNYFLDSASLPGRLQWSSSASLPGVYTKPNPIRIRFIAGYGAAGAVDGGQSMVPAPLKAAILLRLGQLYENRAEELDSRLAPLTIGVERLIAPFRIPV